MLSDYLLRRKCTLRSECLSVPAYPIECLQRFKRLQSSQALNAKTLDRLLYDAIPGASPGLSRVLLAIKRAAHRLTAIKRPLVDSLSLHVVDAHLKDSIDQYSKVTDEVQCSESELAVAYLEYIDSYLMRLCAAASNELFIAAVQLSGWGLYLRIKDFIESELAFHQRDSQCRRRLVSLLYRNAVRPTPFGTFVEVSLHSLSGACSKDLPGYRRVQLSRILLAWMEQQMRSHRDMRYELPIRINNTLAVINGKVEFFTRGPDGTSLTFGSERHVSLTLTRPLGLILKVAKVGENVPFAALVAILTSDGHSTDRATAYLESLIEIGACELGPFVNDGHWDRAKAISEALDKLDSSIARSCSATFTELYRLEREFAESDVETRGHLIKRVHETVLEFCEVVNTERVSLSDMRSYFYEDMIGPESPNEVVSEALLKAQGDFDRLQRLLPVITTNRLEQVMLYELFCTTYGRDANVSLLDFYRHFAKLPQNVLSQAMRGEGSELARPWMNARTELREKLLNQRRSGHLGKRIILDNSWVDELTDSLPREYSPSVSVAYQMQLASEAMESPLVINGATIGHAVRFAKYRHIGGAFQPATSEQAVFHLAGLSLGRIRCDIAAGFAQNSNLRNCTTEYDIEYPRSIADRTQLRSVYTLRDLCVVPDNEMCCLRLVHRDTGAPIDFIPSTSLFPTAGPCLYRFLHLFSPFFIYHGGLWSAISGDRLPIGEYPSVQMGTLTLDKSQVRVELSVVPPVPPPEVTSWRFIDSVNDWRILVGLPPRGFFHVIDNSSAEKDEWLDAVKKWVAKARHMRLRQPHYIDFSNPLLCEVLCTQLLGVKKGTLVVSECLPDPFLTEHTTEYVIENNI